MTPRLSIEIDSVDLMKETAQTALKALDEFFRTASPLYRHGYRIVNRRGRNKLARFR